MSCMGSLRALAGAVPNDGYASDYICEQSNTRFNIALSNMFVHVIASLRETINTTHDNIPSTESRTKYQSTQR